MSKAIKRTAADSTDAETTRVIRTGASRVDADANRTEVINPGDSADSERTSVIDDDVFRPDTETTRVVDDREFEEERRRRELAEQRARERADRQAIEAERQRRAAHAAEPEPEPVAEPAPKRTTDKVLASLGMFLFRIVVGGILGIHGFQHLTQRDLTLRAVQTLPLSSGYAHVGVWVLGISECIAAVCIILGLFTRVAGVGVIIMMVLALTFIFWGNFAIFKTMGFKGELELLLAGCGVLLLSLGSGGWSIDAAYRRSRAAAKAEEAGY
ncbi:DoxX family protein [Cutibacterium equinum]|uniref:DoxX family protein n=1 Tax=Cutibacterium equinum TaxID=3016342 RepID=A0ABY7QYS0_9ACTN|nr:DoxX family protein [Cutibacterium equinum]WCC80181.1 DoxX family protein [Cutibacterium equinum]